MTFNFSYQIVNFNSSSWLVSPKGVLRKRPALLHRRRSGFVTPGTLLSSPMRGDRLDLAAAGSWTAEHAQTLEPLVDAATRPNSPVRSVAIDTARIDRLDTFGAWLLERALRTWS